jgi:hypothetical protein
VGVLVTLYSVFQAGCSYSLHGNRSYLLHLGNYCGLHGCKVSTNLAPIGYSTAIAVGMVKVTLFFVCLKVGIKTA